MYGLVKYDGCYILSDIFTTAVIRATPIVVPIRNLFYYEIHFKTTVLSQIYQSMHARFISDFFNNIAR